jgi:membrane protease YdiL (CAAX protease family)
MNIFLNESGRLRSGWRFSIYFLATFIVTSVIAGVGAFVLILSYSKEEAEAILYGRVGFFIQGLVLLLAAFFVGWACVALFERLKPASLGWALHRGWWSDLLLGSALGAFTVLLAAALAGIRGGFQFEFSQNLGGAIQSLLVALVVFFIAAAGEEAFFRGYGLQTMTRANLAWLGILLTSVPFAFVHLNNPHVSFWFTFTNTVLAGIWLGLAYLKTRSLWFALGLHFSWNWIMGAILGIPVSGITKVAPEPLLHVRYTAPSWLSGADYGLEGGIACTVAVAISILLVWFLPFPRPTDEMLDASPAAGSDDGWVDPNRDARSRDPQGRTESVNI